MIEQISDDGDFVVDSSGKWACNMIDYRWGWDYYRTPRRYGLGIEICCNGRFAIAIHLGSAKVSWGWQLNLDSPVPNG